MQHFFYFMVAECDAAYARAFSRGDFSLSGYTFKPIMGNDRLIRKVFLNELLDAAWITSYAEQKGAPSIVLGSFLDNIASAAYDGAMVTVKSVPSKTEGTPPYSFDLGSVPVSFNRYRKRIAYSLDSSLDNHGEKLNLRRKFRGRQRGEFDRKGAKMAYFVAPEIAAYWKFMREFYELDKGHIDRLNNVPAHDFYKRIVPAECSPFRMPNQETVDFYLKMLNRVIVLYKNSDGKIDERKLTKAEQEAFLSHYVSRHTQHIWDTFFIPPGQKLQQLQWVNRPTREYQQQP